MADIKVQEVEKADQRTLPIFEQVGKLMERIQQRAYELFANRGFVSGCALEDWLTAEHEICWPAAKLSETEQEVQLSVALPGFEPGEVSVAATPRELIVHAAARTEQRHKTPKADGQVLWSEFGSNEVYRRVALAQPIKVSKVTATLSQGLLKIVAKKAVTSALPVPVAAGGLTTKT
jgi:HSP20 family molecular chaperone IbpA